MIKEKELRCALDNNTGELGFLPKHYKKEVVERLIKAGLVKKEMGIKYGVLFNKLTKEFELCAYNNELMDKNETYTIIAADLELNKAGFLTKEYNKVNNNGKTI